ncbi:hypothetical protein [Albimonas pacifica]|uniref:Uncharacterized protein n=1 Tax=Albimonas pacifica TaxID=1114924 RepID=A0A1I3ILV1_9RHOB|nr:hypothetical protein [Albimonas pacifica]SFI48964.1 hypothetical protein SAMN05216258_107130 [Albimonas pacifica]
MPRFLFPTLILALLAAPAALLVATVEREPAVAAAPVPDPATARASRALALRLYGAANGDAPVEVEMTAQEIDGLFATAARAFPGLRGRAEIDARALDLRVSLAPPALAGIGWLNLAAEVAPSDRGLELRRLRLGRLELPPQTTLGAARRLADLLSEQPVGSLLTAMVGRVATAPGALSITLDPTLGRAEDGTPGAADSLRRLAGADLDRVAAHYDAMIEAAYRGDLPRDGSTAAWMGFALESAAAAAAEGRDPLLETRAAILALAAHCGERWAVEAAVGEIPAPVRGGPCNRTRLAERSDLKKHFVLSAAFETAGAAAFSFGLGEVKELVDASDEGTGFSFDDMAADRAGIRWAEAAQAAAAEGPEALVRAARLSMQEAAVMPAIDDLPSFLPESAFRDRFGALDSPAYVAQVEAIDRRIDRLPLHAR